MDEDRKQNEYLNSKVCSMVVINGEKIKQARRWSTDGGVESRLQFKVEFLEGEREGGRG